MSNVQFEGDFDPGQGSTVQSPQVSRNFVNPYSQNSSSGGMAGWLLRKGIIKDESQAKGILLGIVVFNILAIILVVYKFIL